MSLDDLSDDVQERYGEIDEEESISLDRQTRNELAMLQSVFETDSLDELMKRGIHLLFQSTVDTGGLDFHLRREYDVTYDEYLSGMTFEEMRGGNYQPPTEDDRRYQF